MTNHVPISIRGMLDGADGGPVNLMEFEALARQVMDPLYWDYYAGGANDELTVTENMTAFQRIRLRPRMLRDVAERDLSTTVLGQSIALPVMLDPTAFQRLAHPDAELATVRGAMAAGTIAVCSTETHWSFRELRETTGAPLWFQLYTYIDRDVTARLVANAEAAGARALVVTVDATYAGRRERHLRRLLVLPPELQFGNLIEANLTREQMWGQVPLLRLTWSDIAWLRSVTAMPLILKGIMTGEDALLAVEHGVDGIIVSNHGGRQVDGTLPSIEMLPEIVAAVDGRIEVLLDGGIRRGTDVIKALALGARAVLIGRPFLWGLAVSGASGVERVLAILRDELDNAMAQCGVADVKQVERSLVQLPHSYR